MAQSKQQKQQKALTRLLSELQTEENEMRISREVFNLNCAMGYQAEESPF